MILEALRIHSLAALSSVEVELGPGLNVILGPNEAGKTTLFRALWHLLLTPVQLGKQRFQSELQHLLPVGGGDTIGASLRFRSAGGSYLLSKSWGATRQAELLLPNGARISEEEAVAQKLRELLPVNEGTLKSVLLTVQSGLAATLEELEKEKQTLHSLSDLLRKSVLETGGLSLSRFLELLDQRCREYLEHWDLQRQQPEANRGLANPWKKSVGRVLQAYYAFLEAERNHQQVRQAELDYGALTSRLDSCQAELAQKEQELARVDKAASAARERRVLETDLVNKEHMLQEAQEAYELWSELLVRSEHLSRERPDLERRVADLQSEKKRSEAESRHRERRELFQRVLAKRNIWEQAREKLAGLPLLPREVLETMQQLQSEIDRLGATLSAGNLSLSIRARAPLPLKVLTDQDGQRQVKVEEGETLRLQAAGSISVQHADWELEVVSGAGDVERISSERSQARRRLEHLLSERGVSSLSAATAASARYEKQCSEVEGAKKAYEQELGEQAFERLEQEAKAAEAAPPGRELGVIVEELVRTQSRLAQAEAGLESGLKQTEALNEQHRDREALLSRIAELSAQRKTLQESLAALEPLPEGFTDARALLGHFEALKKRVEELRGEAIGLDSDRRNSEKALPDESSEEARGEMEEARRVYLRELERARVLIRVRQASRDLAQRSEEGLFEPFVEVFSKHIDTLSGGRYQRLLLQDSLPQGLMGRDGRYLPYRLLSTGTQDLFALALRLALSEFFLSGAEGFLVLDDPLVDLDPVRQRQAAEVLNGFAAGRQLLLFTCHPAHAELLAQGKLIEIGGEQPGR